MERYWRRSCPLGIRGPDAFNTHKRPPPRRDKNASIGSELCLFGGLLRPYVRQRSTIPASNRQIRETARTICWFVRAGFDFGPMYLAEGFTDIPLEGEYR